jgi:prolipoprotein diacylglyceryltransferase
MLGRIWAIALNTFREAARIKVLYGVLVLVVGANLLALVLGEMSYREEARVARDIGLAGMSIFGSLTAILLGLFLLYNEVQRRTVHAIVSSRSSAGSSSSASGSAWRSCSACSSGCSRSRWC